MEEATIEHIPAEMIKHIMSFLCLEDRKSTRMVCKHWNSISYELDLIGHDCTKVKSYLDLDRISPTSRHVNVEVHDDPRQQSYVMSQFWGRHGRHIKSLSLHPINRIYPMLPFILMRCPNLESIILTDRLFCRYGEKKEEKKTKAIAEVPLVNLSKLKNLQLENFDDIPQNGVDMMQTVFGNAPNLEKLHIGGVGHTTSESDRYAKFTLSLVQTTKVLKELNLSMFYISDEMFRQIIEIVAPELTRLSLGCEMITDFKLNVISDKCLNLQQFSTGGLVRKSHNGPSTTSIQRFVTHLRQATHLSLCRLNLTDVKFPAAFHRVHTLVAIDLNTTGIKSEDLIAAFSVPHVKLEKFILDCFSCMSSETLQQICPNMPNLTYLSVSISRVDSSVLLPICTFNEKLKYLKLNIYPTRRSNRYDGPADVAPLNALTGLVYLSLAGSRTLKGLSALKLRNLREIYLDDFLWSVYDTQNLIENCPFLSVIEPDIVSPLNNFYREILTSRKRTSKSSHSFDDFFASV